MPPASNGNPPYKGRSEELTTNIADFCNKISPKADIRPSAGPKRHRYDSVQLIDRLLPENREKSLSEKSIRPVINMNKQTVVRWER